MGIGGRRGGDYEDQIATGEEGEGEEAGGGEGGAPAADAVAESEGGAELLPPAGEEERTASDD